MNPMIDTMAPALSPEQVLFADIKPAQEAISNYGERGIQLASAQVGRDFEVKKQQKLFEQQRDLQSMRDQMFQDREDTRSAARVRAITQAGINSQITKAEDALRDFGQPLPQRNGMEDGKYLDALHSAWEKASGDDTSLSTKIVYGVFQKVNEAMMAKAKLDSLVEDDAKKIAMSRISISGWMATQDPDIAQKYSDAIKAGQTPTQALASTGLVKDYAAFAQGIFEQTKNQLLSQKGYAVQLNAIQKTTDYNLQLLHNATWAADRQGRMAPKPTASRIINDASTQFESDQAQSAQAALVSYQKNPGDPNAAAALAQEKAKADSAAKLKAQSDAAIANVMGESVGGTPTPAPEYGKTVVSKPLTKESALSNLGLFLDDGNRLQQYTTTTSDEVNPMLYEDVRSPEFQKKLAIAHRIIVAPNLTWEKPRPGLPGIQPGQTYRPAAPAPTVQPPQIFVAPNVPNGTNGAALSMNGGNIFQLPQVQQALTMPPLASISNPNPALNPSDLGIGDPRAEEQGIAYQEYLAQNQ